MAHRYRLYPTPVQEPVCRMHCGHARYVWNLALEQASCWRPGRPPTPGPAERMRQLSEARHGTWLAEGSSSVQQQALRDFDRAWRSFRSGTHRRPRWRKAGRDEGFCVRDVTARKLNRRWAEVTVPKAGRVRFRLSRPLPATVGMARVTLDPAGRWHVSFAAAQPSVPRRPTGALVGIDRGVATTVATTDGGMLRVPTMPKLLRRIERLQARLARQRKGSACRAKTKATIARTHARIGDRRRGWVEQLTTRLVRDHDLIVLEALNTKGMARRPRPKPDTERPGAFLPNGARAKAGLNRGIHRSVWGLLQRRLADKAGASGVQVVLVNPAYSSQQCRSCGHTAPESRESQAVFSCVACGHRNHADRNAAEIILARGLSTLAPAPGPGAYARVSHPPGAAGTSGAAA